MILYINTNSKEEIKFIISDISGNILYLKKNIIDFKDSQKILNLLDIFLQESKISLDNIKFLSVVNGPGINMNFRIGIIISNAIAYIKQIPLITLLSTDFKKDEDFTRITIEKINKKDYSSIIYPEYSVKKNN